MSNVNSELLDLGTSGGKERLYKEIINLMRLFSVCEFKKKSNFSLVIPQDSHIL